MILQRIVLINYSFLSAQIVFVVDKNERNIGDQRLLEYEILKQEPKINIVRLTLEEINERATLDSHKSLIMYLY